MLKISILIIIFVFMIGNFLRLNLRENKLQAIFYFSILLFFILEINSFPNSTLFIGLAGSVLMMLILNLIQTSQSQLKNYWRIPIIAFFLVLYFKNQNFYLIWFVFLLLQFYLVKMKKEIFSLSLSALNTAKYLAFLSVILSYTYENLALFIFFLSLMKIVQFLEGLKVKSRLENLMKA
jgi:hypothetical protein